MNNSYVPIYLLVPFIAWLAAQCLKVIITALKTKGKKDYSIFFKSGNMPSAHAATMIALVTVVGMRDGIDSGLFGIATIVSAVVLYDAVNVRRAVGEQGEALQVLVRSAKQSLVFYTARGHRITEVIAGSVLGLLVALILLTIL